MSASAQSQGQKMPSGPPYPPTAAGLGGQPTVSVDVPICAVFLAMFLAGAVGHMTIFQRNKSRSHKFIPSAVTFGFCMARIVANVLRLTWATRPTNISLAIAAQVFVSAGVVLLFILNLLFAQRMLRGSHPALGWSRPLSLGFKAMYIILVLSLVALIVASVQSFFTLNANTRRIARDLQLYGSSFFAFIAFLPLPILAFISLVPSQKQQQQPTQQFGKGSWRTKALIVGISAVLLCLGAGFRLGTMAMPPRQQTDPAWYHHKACFYVFNFGIEITVVYMWLVGRIDRRFHVPNGSSKVKNYSGVSEGPDKSKDTDMRENVVGTQFDKDNHQSA